MGAVAAFISADDIADANDERLTRLAEGARYVSVVIVAVGALALLGWLWYTIRAQLEVSTGGGFTFGDADDGLSLIERIDLLATSTSLLVQGAMATGIGIALLLWSSKVYASLGGSLHGVQVGDPIPDAEEEKVE